MNKHIHRLVFDRSRGMRVPAAETARAAGKQAGGQTRSVRGAVSSAVVLTFAANLGAVDMVHARTAADTVVRAAMAARSNASPLPLWSNRADGAFKGLRQDTGAFSIRSPNDKSLWIDQTDQRIIINWDSFNIDAGYSVHFQQPTNGSALNRIWDANPTVIMGKLTATGEVILENTNGVIFGRTARVETGKFVATALKLADETFRNGIRNERAGKVVFGGDDADPNGFVTVERGAEIKALAGGDVMLIAPKVYNEGRIETPKGQTILAAGQKVYLYSSLNPAQRGLLVAVDAFTQGPEGVNTVENAVARSYKTVNGETVDDSTSDSTAGLSKKINGIVAEQGSINLVGLAIRQNGVLTATTAVKGQNGGIYLQAQKSTAPALVSDSANPGYEYKVMGQLGSVELGAESITQVLPSTDKVATQTNSETFNKSRIDINGEDIRVRGGAQVLAPSGNISIVAASDAATIASGSKIADNSRVVIEGGATISAAGLRGVELSMSRNQISGRVFSNELADSPVQRGGVLYRSEVLADARELTDVANLTGFYKSIARSAEELSTTGGNVIIKSNGTTVVADGAKVDVSGGSVVYQSGTIASSLLRVGNALVSIDNALRGTRYDQLISSGGAAAVASYAEGKDGGALTVAGQRVYLGKDTVKADVVVGPNQRSGPMASTVDLAKRPDLYASIRPKAGQVSIENMDTVKPMELVQVHTASVSTVPEFDDAQATVLFDAQLAERTEVALNTLQHGGVGTLTLEGGPLTMAAGSQLDLGASGVFKAEAHGGADLQGTIKAAGGTIDIDVNVGDVTLGQTGHLDASGRRLDEVGLTEGRDAMNVNGGTVTVKSTDSVTLAEGSRIDVSAGAWRSSTGTVVTGTAGTVSLTVNNRSSFIDAPGVLTLNGRLSGYDFKSGGTLNLAGMRTLSIGAPADNLGLTLSPGFFSANGFGTFGLSALGDVKVAPDTQLVPVLKNLVLTGQRGRSDAGLVAIDTLEAGLRQPINLSLTASLQPLSDNPEGLKDGGSLTIGRKALVDVGAGGSITLSAGHSLTVEKDATLTAHGGSVSLSLSGVRGGNNPESPDASLDQIGYLPDQEIRLKEGSKIDVSGIAKTVGGLNGRVTGQVLAGGTVSLNYTEPGQEGKRGRVVTEATSEIDVSGASKELNLSRANTKTPVSQGAGTVKVGASDGFKLEGDFKADHDAGVGGGQFVASVSRGGVGDVVRPTANAYPEAERTLTLTATNDDLVAHNTAYGEGAVSAAQLTDAGFDRISLRADNRVVLGTGASLGTAPDKAPLRSIIISSPVLSATDDTRHTLQAAYVGLGDRDIRPIGSSSSQPLAKAGDASLDVNAGLIEVHGHSALQGFSQVGLNATLGANGVVGARRDGEIRLIGRAVNLSDTALKGSLGFDGRLDLTAGQIYATTLSDFTLQGTVGHSTLATHAPQGGSSSQLPLSALAKLALKADTIEHGGVLRQPFGSISFQAGESIALKAGSVLSVSGDGVTVPVGTTINERQWVYSNQGTKDGVSTSTEGTQLLNGLPMAKGILIDGPLLSIDSNASLQVQAGGDLQAWEFVSGAGGTSDTLNSKNVYAVLPNYTYDFAPYDTEITATTQALGTQLQAGDKISITTDNGILAKGSYTLLPSRYALLPGAVLVSATDVKSTSTLSSALKQDDGSAYVSGFKTAAGTAINGGGDTRQLFLLEPSATFLAKSSFTVSSINNYLSNQATKLDKPIPSLPGDAGRVSFVTPNSFDLAGQFNFSGKDGFAGGQLDIAMPKMAVVDEGATAPAGFNAVSAQALNATGADSILLGGTRTSTADGTRVTTSATEVQILAGNVSVGELIAVAQDTLTVADGTVIQSNKPASNKANQLAIQGQGAALVVSNRTNTDVQRKLAGSENHQGHLVLGKATLKGPSVQIDASRQFTLDDRARIEADRFGLGASRIAIGGTSTDPQAVSITGNLLSTVKSAGSIQLRSYSSIDFIGSQAFDTRGDDGKPVLSKLVLDAPELRGLGTDTDTVSFTAGEITLRNTSGLALADAPQASSSNLVLRAEPPLRDTVTGGITIGEGAQHLAFGNATLQSKGDVVFDGKGKLSTQGDIILAASRITATRTADHGVDSAGTLTVTRLAGAHSLNEQVGAGGSLSLAGRRVVQDGVVDVASGKINIMGRGQTGRTDTIVFTEGSVTKAAGWTQKVSSDWSVNAPGGDITATAKTGDIVLRGTLDVSAPVDASQPDQGPSAGTVRLSAAGISADGHEGTLIVGEKAAIKGSAGSDRLSAAVAVDAQRLANEAAAAHGTLGNLATLLQTGGVRREVNVRVRQGDQSLDTTLQAQRVALSTDTGSLTLGAGALIDAHAPQGGLVQLSAGQDLVMASGARIVADSTRAGANGGDVLLSSANGKITLNEGASISAQGDDPLDGRVVLRAGRDDGATDDAQRVRIDPIRANIQAAEIDIEAVRVYTGTQLGTGKSTGTTIGQTTLSNDNLAFLGNSAGVLSALGIDGDARVHLRSGVELRSTGDFSINADDWSLGTTDGVEPMFLTIRAGGDLNVMGSLSDGFGSATRTDGVVKADGASFRLVAGADLQAANLLATREGVGNLTINGDKLIRTTSGSIELAAGKDIELKSSGTGTATTQAVVYVAGRRSELPTGLSFNNPVASAQFTAHGGRLEVKAGGNIMSPAASQLFGNWFFHTGTDPSNVAWWSNLGSFKQGLGSFGGGNVHVAAGGTINNLGVVAPTSARNAVVDETGELRLVVENGGDVSVTAGGDIRGGVYFLGRGEGTVQAGGSIVEGDSLDKAKVPKVGAVLGLMDGHWSVQANGDTTVAAVYNPTMYASPTGGSLGTSVAGAYFTYGDDSGVSIGSVRGDVAWNAEQVNAENGPNMLSYFANLHNVFSTTQEKISVSSAPATFNAKNRTVVSVAPPSVTVSAVQGNLTFNTSAEKPLILFPSATGQLNLFAGQNLLVSVAGTGTNGGLVMADGDLAKWATTANPARNAFFTSSSLPESSTETPFYAILKSKVGGAGVVASTLHQNDKSPAHIHAGEDLTLGTGSSINLPKAAQITAGGDITNLTYTGQHFSDKDITLISAGGNFIGVSSSNATNKTAGLVQVAGLGELQVIAGRQLDLSTSAGIKTVGNRYNTALPDASASIRVAAGMDKTLNLDDWVPLYLANNAEARQQLVGYVKQVLNLDTDLSADQALAYYKTMSQAHQVTFADKVVQDAFVAKFISGDGPYAKAWQAKAVALKVDPSDHDSANFKQFKDDVMFAELNRLGAAAAQLPLSSSAERDALYAEAFNAISLAGVGKGFNFTGDLDLASSTIQTAGTGDQTHGGIDLLVPGGKTLVGLTSFSKAELDEKAQSKSAIASNRGVVTYGGGSIRSMSDGDFLVNVQKVFVVGNGDILLWSSNGSIDSGKGANTDVTVPPPRAVLTDDGVVYQAGAVTTGSGIGLLKLPDGTSLGSVGLYAPRGEVRALDAAIRNEGGGAINVVGVLKGGDNLAGKVVGAPPVVVVPVAIAPNVAPINDPAGGVQAAADGEASGKTRDPSSLLTVDVLGMGGDLEPTAAGPAPTPDCTKYKDEPKKDAKVSQPCADK